MKAIYLMADGTAKAESIRLNTSFIEEPDGYHKVTPEAVTLDKTHRNHALIYVAQDHVPLIGAHMTEEATRDALREIRILKQGRGHPSVSRLWLRVLAGTLATLAKYIGIIIVFAFMAYALTNGSA